MNMTQKQTDFYLKRLRLFRTPAQIARMLECSQPSVDRWLSGKGQPRLAMRDRFEEALSEIYDWLRDQGFYVVADWFEEEDRPQGSAAHRYSPQACQSFLREFLKKPKRYQEVLAEAKRRKFTRSQIDYAASKIGVERVHHSSKRERRRTFKDMDGKTRTKFSERERAYSIWSLSDANG